MKNKIGWCNTTWNPVWGCNNHCEYCYARGMAKRFKKSIAIKETVYKTERLDLLSPSQLLIEGDKIISSLDKFQPTFLHSQFDKELPKKPQRIFVGSMSEIAHWEKRWVRDTLDKILEYPQHKFQFLTKFPKIYAQWYFHPNCWLGVTITKNDDFFKGAYNFIFPKNSETNRHNIKYISFEPLSGEILDLEILKYFDWVIIGAETGNRKGKVIPKREWIEDIVNYCTEKNIPIYLKDSLKNIYPSNVKEFPKEAIKC